MPTTTDVVRALWAAAPCASPWPAHACLGRGLASRSDLRWACGVATPHVGRKRFGWARTGGGGAANGISGTRAPGATAAQRLCLCTTATVHCRDRETAKKGGDADATGGRDEDGAAAGALGGAGLLSSLGVFGKRTMLFVTGKKTLFGLFSVISFKKFVFFPAWIVWAAVSGGMGTMIWLTRTRAPVSGRPQSIIVRDTDTAAAGDETLRQLKGSGLELLRSSHAQTVRLQRVAERLKHSLPALRNLEAATGRGSQLEMNRWLLLPWEFHACSCVTDEMLAFAVPPGRVIISLRVLQLLQTDDELAFVVAHEMAHLLARHAAESMTRRAFWSIMLGTLEQWVGIASSKRTTSLLELPCNRVQELEADHIATALLEQAGYDTQVGVRVLETMRQRIPDIDGPSWLQHWSTHPTVDARIANLHTVSPGALDAQTAAGAAG